MLKTTLKIIAVASLLTAGSHNLTLSVQAAEQVIGRVIGLEPIYTTRTIQTPGVCQRCCPPISCGVSDLRDADFIFRVEPDGSGGLPVSGFA